MSDPVHLPESPSPDDAAADRERVQRVLRQRAALLARPRGALAAYGGLVGEQVEEAVDLVTLELAEHTYAIEADVVREVYAVRDLTPLPTAPSFVLGITNIRGKIIAVLDLGAVLGHPAVGRPSGRVIVAEIDGIEIGVDARQCGVARVPRRRLAPASRQAQERYVKAIGNDTLGVLDLGRIIADTRHTAASLATGAAQ